MFLAVNEPLASCMVVHFWGSGFKWWLGCGFGKVERNFLLIFYSCFSCITQVLPTVFFSNNFGDTKYFVLSHSMDVVSTPPCGTNNFTRRGANLVVNIVLSHCFISSMYASIHLYWLRISGHITLRPKQDGRYFADDVLKCIFLNEDVLISLKIPLKFVPRGPINHIPALVQIMAWRRPGDTPLSEPMLVFVPTHICVTRPQWV